MADYQIFSDGACDIGFEKAAELNIQLIPFYVSIDHENYYKEILEISLDDYFRFMTEEKGYPKTSLPSIQDYIDAFRPALEAGKDVLCLTMTRSLTASQESAMTIHAGRRLPQCKKRSDQLLGGNRGADVASDGNGSHAEKRQISG